MLESRDSKKIIMVEQEDWREKRLGRPETLRGLKHYLWAQIHGHHTFSPLGMGGGEAWKQRLMISTEGPESAMGKQ